MAPKVNSRRRLATASALYGALLAVLCFAPAVALGWGGTPHAQLGDDVGQAFSPDSLNANGVPGYPYITRTPGPPPDLRPFAIIPELDLDAIGKEEGGDPRDGDIADVTYKLRTILAWNSMTEDDYDLIENWSDHDWNVQGLGIDEIPAWPLGEITITHFWDSDVSLLNTVESPWFTDVYPNAWFKAKLLWHRAIEAWSTGDKSLAWMYVGHVLHLMTDQGLAAHAHDDWHAIDDEAMEDWFYGCTASVNLMYSWSNRPRQVECYEDDTPSVYGAPWPQPEGGVMSIPLDNDQIIAALTAAGSWADDVELFDAGTAKVRNLQKLFYLMYTVNQYGDFSPSDGDDGPAIPGDSDDILGWANFNDGIIPHVNPETGEPLTGPDSPDTVVDNDWGDDNDDHDFSYILLAGWRSAFRAAPALIDLFRKTVDDAAPVSDVVVTRADGAPVAEWNNSPLTVRITMATEDRARTELGMPASGVWKRWGQVDGIGDPTEAPDGSVYWAITADGQYIVRPMSTDYMGNVETQDSDFYVRVDTTPPVLTLSDALRPNYLTSEDFLPLWTATDATSGVAEETAYLDGQLVPKGVPIDLALMAGRHTLEVYAFDAAGNFAYQTFAFEVWIDTATFALPAVVNSKSGGEGLMVYVEFPAPYDVGAIRLDTCLLRPGGSIDLAAPFPVVGGWYGNVRGELLGGIADRDKDGVPERLIRFDRSQFLAAFGGVTGEVPAVVWGGLLPDGMPEFIGSVTVQVFTPPAK